MQCFLLSIFWWICWQRMDLRRNVKCQKLLLFAGIFLVQRRALGPISVSGKEQAKWFIAESPAEFNVCFTCLETGSPSDKPGMRPWSGCGQRQGEQKKKVLLLWLNFVWDRRWVTFPLFILPICILISLSTLPCPVSHGLQMTVQNSGIFWNICSLTSLGPNISFPPCKYKGGSRWLTHSLLIFGTAQSKHLRYSPWFLWWAHYTLPEQQLWSTWFLRN